MDNLQGTLDFTKPQIIRLGELFCGAGGIGEGAKLASVPGIKIEHIWATDYSSDACETYKKNLNPKKDVVCKDIRKLDFEALKKLGKVDCLTFGFPCNDFSSVGEQKGVFGNFGALYQYCVIALKKLTPKFFIAENVSGLKSANEGKAFHHILDSFKNSGVGYKLYPHLYQFENYGVPQKRHRIIIVGIRNDIDVEFKIPSTTTFENCDISVKTALANIPIDAANNEYTLQSKIVIARLNYIKEGENAFTANIPEHLQLNVKGARISQIYKRLKADDPAYTITGSGGGGTHVYHFSEPRALTNRERARLQTFPDDFIFIGNKESVRKQIGMAVPPKGVKVIFEALMKSILKIEYEHIESNIAWK